MKHGTAIEWTHLPGHCGETWNPVGGCSHASPGCTHCYAERLAVRFPRHPVYAGTVESRKAGPRFTGKMTRPPDDHPAWSHPLHWRAPRAVFVGDMCDLFHEDRPEEDIDRVFALMALAPQHVYMLLTKRARRMRDYIERKRRNAPEWVHLPEQGGKVLLPYEGGWPTCIWLGVSVEDQERAEERIPDLLATPAARRFLSCEPLLGSIDLQRVKCEHPGSGASYTGAPAELDCLVGTIFDAGATPVADTQASIDWVIAGGESGPKARPMHPDWPRTLRDQCAAAGVPFFFKQWGAWLPWDLTAQAPFWESQAGHHEDGHALFPADMDADNRWDDGLWAIPEAEPVPFQRVGKRAAGDLLDGRRHHAWPELPR